MSESLNTTFSTEELWQLLKEKGYKNFNIIDTLYTFLKNLRNNGKIKGERNGVAYLYDQHDLQVIEGEITKFNSIFENGMTSEFLHEYFTQNGFINITKRTLRDLLKRLRESEKVSYMKLGASFIYESSSLSVIEKVLNNADKTSNAPSYFGLMSPIEIHAKVTEENLTHQDQKSFQQFLFNLRKDKHIKGKKCKSTYYYSQPEFDVIKEVLIKRNSAGLSPDEVLEKLINIGLNLEKDHLASLLSYLRKKRAIKGVRIGKTYFHSSEEFQIVEEYIRERNLHLSDDFFQNDFATCEDAAELLGVSATYSRQLIKKGVFEGVKKYKENWMIPKSSIQNYKDSIDTKDYLKVSELAAQIGQEAEYIHHRIKNGTLKATKLKIKEYFIHIDEVARFIEAYEESIAEFTNSTALNDLELFFKSLEKTLPKETDLYFKHWVTKKINDSTGRASTIKDLYHYLKRLYEYLLTKSNGIEIFDFIDKTLESIVEDETLSKRLKKEFVLFYNYVLAKKGIIKNKKLIVDGAGKNKESKEKEIYTPEIYHAYYDYVQDMKMHIPRAIKKRNYSNMWVYVIMHLTNIWRGNDIILEMHEVDLELIDVTTFEFFNESILSSTQAQIIINDLYLKLEGSIASKNKNDLRFYVDPSLEACFATALVITEIHRRKYTGKQKHKALLLGTFVVGKKGEYLLTSGSDTHLSFFDSNKSLRHFKSLIMNRSTALYLFHHLLEEDGKESAQALEIVKTARSHERNETTAIYVEATNRDGSIHRVSLNLFRRGHFGWLYNSIVKLATKASSKHYLEDRTVLISKNREVLSPMQVEKWSGFLLNHSRKKHDAIMRKLLKMSEDELLYLLYKIFKGLMPSKEKEGQCFIYPDCEFQARKTCFGCPNFIPQQMVLIEATQEFRTRIKKLQESFMHDAIRIRESMFINNLLCILSQAQEYLGTGKLDAFITSEEISEALESVNEVFLTTDEIDCLLSDQSEKTLIGWGK